MGGSTSQVMAINVFKGKKPYRIIFQELLMAIGTIRASGFFFIMVAMPPTLKFFICPVLERVPSGNIKADQRRIFIVLAKFKISAIDCFESLRSILAPPPCRRLNEMLGMPEASSILEIN